MNTALNPDLFARVMKLSGPARADLLEFLGETTLDADSVESLIDEIETRAAEAGESKPS